MITSVSWTQKEPLIRVVTSLGCLWIASLLLLAYQAKLWIVDAIHRPVLFGGNVVVMLLLLVFFQGMALVCHKRLRNKRESARA
jgi:hypothetical protein